MPRLFVFGTLKRGCVYHNTMKNAAFEGEALTRDALFDLVEVEDTPHVYPGFVSGNFRIAGEVYALCDEHLAAIDEFEEVGTLYDRCEIEIEGMGPCWTYILRDQAALPTKTNSPRIRRDAGTAQWIEKE